MLLEVRLITGQSSLEAYESGTPNALRRTALEHRRTILPLLKFTRVMGGYGG